MEVVIERLGGAPISFEAFAVKHGLAVKVGERPAGLGQDRYYAKFELSDVLVGGGTLGLYGNGNTPEEAIADYAKALEGKLLVIDAYRNTRRKIQCPNEWTKEN